MNLKFVPFNSTSRKYLRMVIHIDSFNDMLLEHPLICFETLCTKEWHKLFSSSGFLEQFYRSIFWLINLERNCLSFNFPIISTICIINSRFPFFDLRYYKKRRMLKQQKSLSFPSMCVCHKLQWNQSLENLFLLQCLLSKEFKRRIPTLMFVNSMKSPPRGGLEIIHS